MSGPYESVIGRDIDEVVSRYVENKQTYYTVSKNEAVLCGVVIKIDDKSNRAVNIERIQIRPQLLIKSLIIVIIVKQNQITAKHFVI